MQRAQDVLKKAQIAHQTGQFGLAEQLYDRLLASNERHWGIESGLGTLYTQAGRLGVAKHFLQAAISHVPDNPVMRLDYEQNLAGLWCNLAIAYRSNGENERAIEAYQKSLAINPLDAAVLSNLSGCFINYGQPERALYWADKALEVDPKFPQARNHRSLALLEMGNYELGFREYDARMDLPQFHRRPYTCAMWCGQQVDVLAVHGEQGLGDEILFCTLLRKALTRAKEIHVECSPRLVGLFTNSFAGQPVKFYGTHDELAAGCKPDAWVAMGSLPRILAPWEKVEYLKASKPYGKGAWPRVGISWRGGSMATHEYVRNAPIDAWKPLIKAARMAGVEVISLQYGQADEYAQELEVPHDAAGIADMDVLTAMVQSCDLVVSVCNTTVHQAGASGTPAWQLVPSKPDWRCGMKSEKYVWYDSVDFIRQKEGEDWFAVLLRTTERFAKWAEQNVTGLVE